MFKYILKRLGFALLILFGVSLIIYILTRCMPVSYVEKKIAELQNVTVDPEAIERMKRMYGLEDDSFLGILKGYFSWLGSLFKFDLGKSFVYGD